VTLYPASPNNLKLYINPNTYTFTGALNSSFYNNNGWNFIGLSIGTDKNQDDSSFMACVYTYTESNPTPPT